MFLNYTPFSPLAFESLFPSDERFQIVVLRGAVDIVPNAAQRPIQTQDAPSTAEQFRAEPSTSTLLY